MIGPAILDGVGDEFVEPARILGVVWEGTTTSGDTVELRHRGDNALLWKGRTDSTQTYLGAIFGQHGLHCPNGFWLAQVSAGQLLVYLRED